jgi:hypothetical protein
MTCWTNGAVCCSAAASRCAVASFHPVSQRCTWWAWRTLASATASLLFPIHRTRRTPPPPAGYRTRVITAGVIPGLYVAYKRSHVKQYFKEAQALRTETTINDPKDFQPNKSLHTLPKLRAIGQHVNTRLLEVEQLADTGILANSLFERLSIRLLAKRASAPLPFALEIDACMHYSARCAASAMCQAAFATVTCDPWWLACSAATWRLTHAAP